MKHGKVLNFKRGGRVAIELGVNILELHPDDFQTLFLLVDQINEFEARHCRLDHLGLEQERSAEVFHVAE